MVERARARSERVWVAEKGAYLGMDFGISKLVKVAQKFQDMRHYNERGTMGAGGFSNTT